MHVQVVCCCCISFSYGFHLANLAFASHFAWHWRLPHTTDTISIFRVLLFPHPAETRQVRQCPLGGPLTPNVTRVNGTRRLTTSCDTHVEDGIALISIRIISPALEWLLCYCIEAQSARPPCASTCRTSSVDQLCHHLDGDTDDFSSAFGAPYGRLVHI